MQGHRTAHPEQSFWDQHPRAGESPAAQAGQHCCSSAWTRAGRQKNSSQPHLTPLFCSDWNKLLSLTLLSSPRMQSQHLWNAAASATLNPGWGNQFHRCESEQELQTLSKHHLSRLCVHCWHSIHGFTLSRKGTGAQGHQCQGCCRKPTEQQMSKLCCSNQTALTLR